MSTTEAAIQPERVQHCNNTISSNIAQEGLSCGSTIQISNSCNRTFQYSYKGYLFLSMKSKPFLLKASFQTWVPSASLCLQESDGSPVFLLYHWSNLTPVVTVSYASHSHLSTTHYRNDSMAPFALTSRRYPQTCVVWDSNKSNTDLPPLTNPDEQRSRWTNPLSKTSVSAPTSLFCCSPYTCSIGSKWHLEKHSPLQNTVRIPTNSQPHWRIC